ncbi:MAG: hypothetical protein ACRD36_00310, partial [Candidatus Acidiferrum sp.]
MPEGDLTPQRPPAATLLPTTRLQCPECRAWLESRHLGDHLKRNHQYHFFRGMWRSREATIDDAAAATVAVNPDPEAWRVLVDVVQERDGRHAAVALASILGMAIDHQAEEKKTEIADAVAGLLIVFDDCQMLAAALSSDQSTGAHFLALPLLSRLRPPLSARLFQPAMALLLDRRLPADGQLTVTASLLQSVPPDDERCADFLRSLVSGLTRVRALERLRELEKRTGKHPAVDALSARLEGKVRMVCPRCGLEFRRPDMIGHLWEAHRLVLAGRRVREPWGVIEEWVQAFIARPDPELLERCRTLGERLDPEQGIARVNRLILSRGVADAEAESAVMEEAGEEHASVCPACHGLVAVPVETPAFVIYQRSGRLSSHGYTVEVSEKGILSHVDVRTPAELIYRGREPARQLTLRGAMAFIVGPLIALAVLAACLWPRNAVLYGVIPLLLIALAAYAAVVIGWRIDVPAEVRARNYAWTLLTPRLHQSGFVTDDAAFLAGLANTSRGDGYGRLRASLLPRIVSRTQQALLLGTAPAGFLGPLLRLVIEDDEAGRDPVPRVADEVSRCFEGKLPLAVAEHLLADWQADWWTEGNLSRLRILMCDRAFAAGFEVRNLLDAGLNSPALGEALGVDWPLQLGGLRLLWSQRATRPWDRCGHAETVFQLAEDSLNGPLLAAHPDLLLFQEDNRWLVVADGGKGKLSPARIAMTVHGVLLQEIEYGSSPRILELQSKVIGHSMLLGTAIFRGPQPLDDLA